jgi:hypothetical protein
VNANRLGLIGPSMALAHRLTGHERRFSAVEVVRHSNRRPEIVAKISVTSRSSIGLGPDVFQWINVIGTKAPIGEHVFGVSLPHRLI